MAYGLFKDGSVMDMAGASDADFARYGCEPCSKARFEQGRKEMALRRLRELVPVGTVLQAVCTHRSSSGMSHRYRVFVASNGRVLEITSNVGTAVGYRTHKDGDLVLGGCGYSKTHDIGYSLGCVLWPKGTPEPHGTRNGEPDTCGGYAIRCDG